MTRKDYERIAAAVRNSANAARYATAEGLARDMATAYVADVAKELSVTLTDDNPRFDRARFLAACGVTTV